MEMQKNKNKVEKAKTSGTCKSLEYVSVMNCYIFTIQASLEKKKKLTWLGVCRECLGLCVLNKD